MIRSRINYSTMAGGVVDHEQTHKAGRGPGGLAGRIRGWIGRLGGGERPEGAQGAPARRHGAVGVDTSRRGVAARHYAAELAAARRQQLERAAARQARVDELEQHAPAGVWGYQDVVDREA